MEIIKPGYSRITSILAPFSGIDKIPKNILDAACDRGSRVHALCQGIIEEIKVIVPDELQGYIDSFLQWKEGKFFLPNPGRMYDDHLMITGEADGLYQTDNETFIFDLKTSQKEGNTWALQGAAYSHMMKHSIARQTFIILDKAGGAPKEFFYEYRQNIQTFYKCLDLYNLFFKTKRENEGYEYL